MNSVSFYNVQHSTFYMVCHKLELAINLPIALQHQTERHVCRNNNNTYSKVKVH